MTTGGSTITADLVPEKRIAEGIGYFGMEMAFSVAFTPYAGDQIMGTNDFSTLFNVAAIFSIASLIIALLIKNAPHQDR